MRSTALLVLVIGIGLVSGAWAEAEPATQPAKISAAQTQATGRPWLGIRISDVNDPDVQKVAEALGYTGETGILVQDLMPGAPSAGKLQPGDILIEVNGEIITGIATLQDHVAAAGPGGELALSVFRQKKVQTVKVTVGAVPRK